MARACVLASALYAGSASAASPELLEDLRAAFGPDFVVAELEAPVIEDSRAWIERPEGVYEYRFVLGSDDGAERQTEMHVPVAARPERAWQRRIGDELVETFVAEPDRDLLLVEELDREHGYRIEISPGVHLPARIEPGAVWEIDASLDVYETETGEQAHEGSLEALHRYLGAFRVRTPAGEFDTILLREDFTLRVGPLHAEDDRLLFFARGLGLVAEKEALRASALLLLRMREKTAKVLVSVPDAAADFL